MNLKILFFIMISLSAMETMICISCGNNTDKKNIDTIKRKLQVYQAIPCIQELLEQIVVANDKFYNPKEYFYSLSFKKEQNKSYMVIEAAKYKSSKVFDYLGGIKVSRAIFLCRGDIIDNTLFKISNNSFLFVRLENSESNEILFFGQEPSLRGSYLECDGFDIFLEIYTKEPILAYKMKNQKINRIYR